MEAGKIALTLAVGACGGMLLGKRHVPGGYLVGSMIFVAALSIATGLASIPSSLKLLTQIISGIFIGSKISRKDLPVLARLLLPALLAAGTMIALCLALGTILGKTTAMSTVTALMCCSPGGVVDITMMCMDVGADISVVSVLQAMRLFLVVGVFPTLMRRLFASGLGRKMFRKYPMTVEQLPPEQRTSPTVRSVALWPKPVRIAATFAVSAAAGYLGKLSGMPAGALLFSMIGSAGFNIASGQHTMPKPVKQGAQILAGALIGVTMTLEAVVGLKSILVPLVVIMLCYFVFNLFIAFLLLHFRQFDAVTAFFSCTPGGAADICLIVEDMGGDAAKISVMQTVRACVVIGFYSLLLTWIA